MKKKNIIFLCFGILLSAFIINKRVYAVNITKCQDYYGGVSGMRYTDLDENSRYHCVPEAPLSVSKYNCVYSTNKVNGKSWYNQSNAWAVSNNRTPWDDIVVLNPNSTSMPLYVFSTLYTCKDGPDDINAGSARNLTGAAGITNENSSWLYPANGSLVYPFGSTVASCGVKTSSSESLSVINWGTNSNNVSDYLYLTRGYNGGKGTITGFPSNSNYTYRTIYLNPKRFIDICINGVPGNCNRLGDGVVTDGGKYKEYNFRYMIGGLFHSQSGMNCSNTGNQFFSFRIKVPQFSNVFTPSASTSINRTQIYNGESARFTHTLNITQSTDPNSSKTLYYRLTDGPSTQVRLDNYSSDPYRYRDYNKGGRSREIRGGDSAAEVVDTLYEDFPAKPEYYGKRVCRRIAYNWDNGTPGWGQGFSEEKCFTVIPPIINTEARIDANKTQVFVGETIIFTPHINYLEFKNKATDSIRYNTYYFDNMGDGNTPINARTVRSFDYYHTNPIWSPGQDIPNGQIYHTVTYDDLRRGKVCVGISSKINNPYDSWKVGKYACVTILRRYNLTPNVKLSSDIAIPGEKIRVIGTIDKDQDPMIASSNFQISSISYRPADKATLPRAKNNENHSIYYNKNNGYEFRILQSGNYISYDIGNSTKEVYSGEITIPEKPVGSRICFELTVSPWQSPNPPTLYHHSNQVCAVIAKKPKTQIHGGGLVVAEGKVEGSVSTRNNKIYGSWSEYDIVARNSIDTQVASALGYGLNGIDAYTDRTYLQKLTFENVNGYGRFKTNLDDFSHSIGKLNNLYDYFNTKNPQNYSGTGLQVSALYSPNRITAYKSVGKNLTLVPSTLPNKKQIVLIVEDGNLIIAGDQKYQSGGLKSVEDLPQLVLIVRNGNVIINEGVTQVDAWIYASGNRNDKGILYTCNHSENQVTNKNCNKQLTINGPVMADYVKLLRTANSDYSPDTLSSPAELFNLRPDAYLWANSLIVNDTFASTVYIQEMAPRY